MAADVRRRCTGLADRLGSRLSRGGRRGRRDRLSVVLVGAGTAANLVIGIGYAVVHRWPPPAPSSHVSSTTATPRPPVRAVRDLLDRRSQAVSRHDRVAFLATVDPSEEAFRADQKRLFGNLAKMPIAGWRERPTEGGFVASATGWSSRIHLTYRLRGFDRGGVVRTEYLAFDRRPGAGWAVSGTASPRGHRGDPPIWAEGRLTVVRGRHTLVLGNGDDRSTLHDIADRLDRAVAVVSDVVGRDWARRVVVLAPATRRQAERLIGGVRNLDDLAALATVTGAPGDVTGGQNRIVISPKAFDRLSSLGRHVVLTHELTHVATDAASDSRTPMWLVEGLADYVGYRGVRLGTRAVAAELADDVAQRRVPRRLPGRDAFGGSGKALSKAYEEAWLACRMIAHRYGEGTLMRLYRAAGRGRAGDPHAQRRALRDTLGVGIHELTAMWRSYLRKELG